eukprot:gnl/MRDRNA2_/MRDRNA2_94637_c0_seq1.p1 gnl/MRDRNA2_/MRDRNA2_94637_c0~~gnl/MRDRNA2_/MRDRNA2_94637_c0_seq1.p1  ORF type:complete len:268 (+),score=38.58 gnl/MRDRNA2_/MRDRNA2_94637_c0_seq1:69-872(+)
MLTMQRIPEEYALPNLLGTTRQTQFWREVEREPDAVVLAKMRSSKSRDWSVPQSPAPVAKKKVAKAKPQPPASTPAANSKLQVPKAKVRPRSAPSGRARPKLSVSEAEKELMGAVCRGDLKKVEELLAEYGTSLIGGLSSHAIIHAARNNPKMCDLLHGAVQLHKKECSSTVAPDLAKRSEIKGDGQIKHAAKGEMKPKPSYMRETFLLSSGSSCNLAPCSDQDLHAKENRLAPTRGRSASVPHISTPISVPKRSGSNTRPRRQSIY